MAEQWYFRPEPKLPFIRLLFPAVTVLLGQWLQILPATPLSGVMPWFGSMAIFYWGIYRPQALPVWLCFGLGLLEDLTTGAIPGVYALFYVILRQMSHAQRSLLARRSFAMVWLTFSLGWAGMVLIQAFLLTSLGYPLDLLALAKLAMTFFAFPCVYALLGRVHYRLVEGGWL